MPRGLTPAARGRRFGLPVGVALLALAAVSLWRGHVLPPRAMGALAALLLAGALLAPAALLPVERAWMRLGHALSTVTTPIVLGAIWFLVLTPFGLVRRALGRNALVPRLEGNGYWVTLDRAARAGRSMRRQF